MLDNFLELKNLSFSYSDSKQVIDSVDLSVAKGEFVAVLGYNGSGKSTLAKLMNGILTPTSGSVLVGDLDTSREEDLFDIRRRIGMVFQNPDNQIVASTVEEDVAFALENLGVPSKEMQERVDKALQAVGMTRHRNSGPHRLSGGQKQRVAIAGILAMSPECIILDEPTAMLDPKGRERVISTVLELNKQRGITIILITHFMEEAALADRVVVLSGGKVAMNDTPQNVFSFPEKLSALGLGVPPTVELAGKLRNMGFSISQDVIAPQLLVDRLLEIYNGGRA